MRTWPWILAAVASSMFFLVAMPFITALALLENQGDEVLIQSPNCGFWKAPFFGDDIVAMSILTNQSWEAASYVDNCYETDIPSSFCNGFLVQRRLPAIQWSAAECPFDDDICLHTNKFPALELQTEVLDSHKDFGINAPLNERVKVQRKTVCSPLNVAKFTNITTTDMPGEKIRAVYFGPTAGSDYTFSVSNYEQFTTSGYHLSVVSNYPANGTTAASIFTPIKQLARNDADVSVIFLNNNMIPIKGINGPCKDPFFSATNKSMPLSKDYFLPDSPITAIGCTDQYYFGNSATNQWTKPMAVLDTPDSSNYTKGWGFTSRQIAAIASITWALGDGGSIDRVIMGLETEALLAKKYPGVFSGFQNPLPNDQWKKEVNYWFSIGLAKLQLHLVRIATGPPDITAPGLQNMLPLLAADKEKLVDLICHSQKVHNDNFRNYHRAGFFVVAIIGGMLIILTRVYLWFIAWYSKESEQVLSWTSYSPLQLLRMALEGAGMADWRGCDDETPYLEPWTRAAGDLDTTGRDDNGKHHPRWRVHEDQISLVCIQPDARHPAAQILVDENRGMPLADFHRRGTGQAVPAT